MSFLDYFKPKNSAKSAKDRLTLVLAHERSANIPYIDEMKNEIIAVIRKYTKSDKINFKTDGNQDINMLEIEITLNEKVT
ncbi:cell division topological specificity factor MinE [Helicobacter sp. 16-1353]|uniref:cell division topological specificity factor MinE n=1 Tax=Helicobacter sp. 16-1353 TaxID=2004996 RepID=UPI000DCD43C6|nr:cell division topological specificity factor MinE [Helicobacter sp. 16-1353]RAX55338.1 cell division topological specificity factor MinE [Helicobacter sp. 16-1353]